MKIQNLKPNPDNPRIVSEEKLSILRKTIEEFGDLGGIVFNRRTGQLVGGHQRVKAIDENAKVVLEHQLKTPNAVGTVATGHILVRCGDVVERFAYREVDWDLAKEKAANIAANKGVGDWDIAALGDWMRDLDDFGFDLDLTLFDRDEREEFFAPIKSKTPSDSSDEKPVKDLPQREVIECPNCGYIRGLTPGKKA